MSPFCLGMGAATALSPSEIPVRANLWALKRLGARWVPALSAVGNMREEIAPLDLVVPDQVFDRTRSRVNSFFEGGIVVHCNVSYRRSQRAPTVVPMVARFDAHARAGYDFP